MLVTSMMPTRHRRKFIPRALKMWQRQTWIEKELVIVEDGDDDISDLIPRDDPRIRYYRETATLGEKLNFIAKVAKGEVLIMVDDDDWNAPTRIERQVEHLRISGAKFVGMSSLVFYREGDDHGMEYTADAWYASGSTHCYLRSYALKYPRPDQTLGEDNVAVALARENRVLSTMSGCYDLVACNHDSNCSPKLIKPELAWLKALGPPDNYKQIPLDMFRRTVTL